MNDRIPNNLEECFEILKQELSAEDIEYIKSMDSTAKLHHTLGRRIRNRWGFWSESKLKEYFKKMGLFHPDDMSGIILKSFHCHLKNKPLNLDEQVKYYQDYWKKAREKYKDNIYTFKNEKI
jgi:hypothetical protein